MSSSAVLDGKAVRTSPILWILGGLLFFFLAGIGSQVLYDAADIFRQPVREDYFAEKVRPLERERTALMNAPNPRATQLSRAEHDLADQERVLRSAEASWRHWLETRATLGKVAHEDEEVRSRRNRLDGLRHERDEAERVLVALREQTDPRDAKLAELDIRINKAQEEAESQYQAVMAEWRWKVLLVRLAIVIPVWAVAVYLWKRREKSAYITLLWGYWVFAAWMLLYGVGPYLPHYGGYVPLGLGALTTCWMAVSLVRRFNRFAAQRRRQIVDRAIAAHLCPGCDRDYLVGCPSALEQGLARKARMLRYDAEALRPRHCPACGLSLYGACAACGHIQVVHHDFCATCGAAWHTQVAQA